LVGTPFQLADAERLPDWTVQAVEALLPRIGAGQRVVLINGHYVPRFSKPAGLPAGVLLCSLGSALDGRRELVAPHLAKYADFDDAPFVALNTAFLRDGLFLYLPRGTVLREPLHLVHVGHANGEPVACHPRTLIVCDSNTQATVVQSYVGTDGTYFANAVTEVVLGENAH